MVSMQQAEDTFLYSMNEHDNSRYDLGVLFTALRNALNIVCETKYSYREISLIDVSKHISTFQREIVSFENDSSLPKAW